MEIDQNLLRPFHRCFAMLYAWCKRNAWIFDFGVRALNGDSGRTTAGWMPQMFVFSSFGLIMIAYCSIGIPLAIPCAILDAIASVIGRHLSKQYAARIVRLGKFGFTRPRWWIELSATFFTTSMTLMLMTLASANPVAPFPAWFDIGIEIAAQLARFSFGLFLLTAALGMTLGIWRRRPMRGRAIEIVAPAFWFVVFMVVIQNTPDSWTVPIVAVFTIAAVLTAICYYVIDGNSKNSPQLTVTPSNPDRSYPT